MGGKPKKSLGTQKRRRYLYHNRHTKGLVSVSIVIYRKGRSTNTIRKDKLLLKKKNKNKKQCSKDSYPSAKFSYKY